MESPKDQVINPFINTEDLKLKNQFELIEITSKF